MMGKARGDLGTRRRLRWSWFGLLMGLQATAVPPLGAQGGRGPIDLTLERMVELTLSSSFRIRNLILDVRREQLNLQAEQARLKSSVEMNLAVPSFRMTSEPRWNSVLQRNEIVQENSRRWEGELSVRQPVILFGYPTNGYFSFNNRMYRYLQIDRNGNEDIRYYNRYYLRYTQPLFQPNSLRNSLEQAKLNLERSELGFQEDVLGVVDEVSREYFDLFQIAVRRDNRRALVRYLERALEMARDLAATDPARSLEVDQIQVELANAREQVQQSESNLRLRLASAKQRLGLSEADSVVIEPVLTFSPVPIDVDEATRYAMDLTPRMRQLTIGLRQSELRLEETKSRGGFRVDLALSYGREKRDEIFDRLWVRPDNSYTLDVNASLPVWDWGARKARLEAGRIGIEQARLRIEEAQIQIISNVRNEVLNVQEFEGRTMAMRDNLELARQVSENSFQRYEAGSIPVTDLILNLRREMDTAENLSDAYVGWRRALVRLQRLTYFDFERRVPVLERYGIRGTTVAVNGAADGTGR